MRTLFLLAITLAMPSAALADDVVVGPPAPQIERFTTVSHDGEPSTSRLQLAGIIAATAALDYWTTQRGRAAGLVEENPVMGDGGGVLLFGKALAAPAYVVGVPMIERRWPRIGRVVKWGIPLAWSAIAVRNEHRRAQALR